MTGIFAGKNLQMYVNRLKWIRGSQEKLLKAAKNQTMGGGWMKLGSKEILPFSRVIEEKASPDLWVENKPASFKFPR